MLLEKYSNFLTDKEWDYVIEKTLKGNNWSFSGHSGKDYGFSFFYMELINDKFFTKTMLKKIENISNKKLMITYNELVSKYDYVSCHWYIT